MCAEKNRKLVQDHLGKEDNSIEGFSQAKTWALRKKLCPKNTMEPPAAKKDEHGNLVTNKAQLENLYLKTYQERLKPNQIKPSLQEVEYLKEYLFEIRLKLARNISSRNWNMEDLNKALKSFKNNKARDAFGHTYVLFKYGGTDLKISLLNLCNAVKNKHIYPEIFQPSNISSIYKRKGEKNDLNNDRGIFNVVKIRSILDKLVYNEKYEVIEASMSNSNIGARKNRNIRDHLLVINSILQEVSQDKSKNIDIGIYDVNKCYDKLWYKEIANDFYDSGVDDDNFVLVTNSNRKCQVAVKTPWGSTSKRTLLQEIEMQGTVLTSLKCSVQIDGLGKDFLKNKKNKDILYKYMNVISIPPLYMVDDILTISEAGTKSIIMNASVQSKMDVKKLELGQSKCFK